MLEPLAVDPNRSVAPAANSMASARLVFPAPAGPTRAITRAALGGCPATRPSLRPSYGRSRRPLRGPRGVVWKPPPSACFSRFARGNGLRRTGLGGARSSFHMASIAERAEKAARAAPHEKGRHAETPAQIPAAGWKEIAFRTWKESSKDNVS